MLHEISIMCPAIYEATYFSHSTCGINLTVSQTNKCIMRKELRDKTKSVEFLSRIAIAGVQPMNKQKVIVF